MDYRSSADSHSSQDSGRSDSESQDEAGYEADATDVTDASDSNSDGDWDADGDGQMADLAGLLADNAHPPEYYIRQWQESNESDCEEEDYSLGITLLLDR